MITWATLLDGYNPMGEIASRFSTFADVFSTRSYVDLYLAILNSSVEILRFIFQAFVSSAFHAALFFGIIYFVFAPMYKRLSNL